MSHPFASFPAQTPGARSPAWRSRAWRARMATLALVLLLAGGLGLRHAFGAGRESALPTPDEVKAAYLHKFAGYVDWPAPVLEDPDEPFVVGVAGADEVYRELESIVAGRPVAGRRVEARRLDRPEPEANVHVLFLGKALAGDAWSWLAAFAGRPVLTVTETPNGLDMGAVLNFVELDNRVRFEASTQAADNAGLRLSSRLLAVAERVTDPAQ